MESTLNAAATTGQSFLEKLRGATQAAHRSLEQLPLSRVIVDPSLNKEQYISYLLAMRDVHADVEQNIFPLLKDRLPDIASRQKTVLIDADLQHQQTTPALLSSAPITASLQYPSKAFAWGIMYVVEGSSLGGRVILKNIQTALALDAQAGARYFNGYGEHTGIYWKNFLQALTRFEAEEGAAGEIIEGANHAFQKIHRHFEVVNS